MNSTRENEKKCQCFITSWKAESVVKFDRVVFAANAVNLDSVPLSAVASVEVVGDVVEHGN